MRSRLNLPGVELELEQWNGIPKTHIPDISKPGCKGRVDLDSAGSRQSSAFARRPGGLQTMLWIKSGPHL